MKKIILASNSPRRKELLAMLGVPFEVVASDAEEVITHTDPAKVTEELSFQKAEAVARGRADAIVIGADTVVAAGNRILGKPANRAEAREMISFLQGRAHMVYTGVTIQETGAWEKAADLAAEAAHRTVTTREAGAHGQDRRLTFSEGTKVWVAPMTEDEIEWYIAGKEPYDKAGGYGIQGAFGRFIEGIEGDYFNVVGLPVHRMYREMSRFCDLLIPMTHDASKLRSFAQT